MAFAPFHLEAVIPKSILKLALRLTLCGHTSCLLCLRSVQTASSTTPGAKWMPKIVRGQPSIWHINTDDSLCLTSKGWALFQVYSCDMAMHKFTRIGTVAGAVP
ncbi:hypothetical protein L202_08341 [Cryptococcus amylolentus CBS 6039]|uniref:Uncharacterized protein n=1 Tax=Cryptococcus amylolentus CBS 6039 TaxID=1295533 RepID=A0A1E3HAX9_9TREE|nr:hypothetical protein L202_08341 [Cryptococcus amylolentus CBS 6039]ODN72926.1 hypothetical protein L202_08341 [Cryptococcus amylolentus CBS 6039]